MPGLETKIETPCKRICAVHRTLRLCVGCGRTLDEIARWIDTTPVERRAVMAELPARLAAIGDADAA